MAIVLVFLLVLGAVSLDSDRSTSEAVAFEAPVETETVREKQRTGTDREPGPCRYGDGPLLQRDLSLPRNRVAPLNRRAGEDEALVSPYE